MLLFEGEYLNGRRHGKGKYYVINKKFQSELLFEGEYLYDFPRKGKFYVNGILEYEGDFLFNRKWKGKGFDKNGNVIYILNNGNCNVKEYSFGNLIFESEYINGMRNGKGKEYEHNNLEFEGEYLNNKKWNGKFNINLDKDGNKIFEGEYLNGKLWNGKGYEKDNNNLLFELKGNGIIKKYFQNGNLLYEAEYKNGEINGKVKQYFFWNY